MHDYFDSQKRVSVQQLWVESDDRLAADTGTHRFRPAGAASGDGIRVSNAEATPIAVTIRRAVPTGQTIPARGWKFRTSAELTQPLHVACAISGRNGLIEFLVPRL
jgi:hypothetical protein